MRNEITCKLIQTSLNFLPLLAVNIYSDSNIILSKTARRAPAIYPGCNSEYFLNPLKT